MNSENRITENPANKPNNNSLFRATTALFFLVLVVYILYHLQTVLLPLLFSILIAISLYPVARWLEKIRLGKITASLIAVLIALLVIVGLSWFIIHQVIVIGKDGNSLTTKFTTIFEYIQVWIRDRFGLEPTDQLTQLKEKAIENLNSAGGYALGAFGSVTNVLVNAILVPLLTFFLLYYRVFFREFFFLAFPNTPNEKIHLVLNKIYEVVQSYLVGLAIVMAIVAVLNTVGLWVMGIQYAWFFGVLASLLMLLPYFGIAIGSILPALFALATKDSYWYAIGILIWFQFVQFLEGNLITPNIVGSKVSVNPLMAILVIILGGMLFGLAGLILAIPIAAVVKVLLDANRSTAAFGFLIGEPEKIHLKRFSMNELMHKWNLTDYVKKKKKN